MQQPPRPNNIGKRRTITSITGRKVHLVITDEIVIPQGTGKLIYFQKLQFEKDGRTEYRFTYYMLGHKPSRRGRWVFGQYSLMIPQRELRLLLRKTPSTITIESSTSSEASAQQVVCEMLWRHTMRHAPPNLPVYADARERRANSTFSDGPPQSKTLDGQAVDGPSASVILAV